MTRAPLMQPTLRFLLVLTWMTLVSVSSIAEEWAAGVPVGTPFPNVQATDQLGNSWNRKQLLGENGLAFFFIRSTDW